MPHYNIPMMSGAKVPDFDAYGLLRTAHSHVSAPLRSVLNMCHWHIAPYPLFAYRGKRSRHAGTGISTSMICLPEGIP